MTHRRHLVALLAAFVPALASAQFTTFVPPASRSDSARAAVVADQKAHADSITHTTLTNMKAWVDSAAGVSVAQTDSAQAAEGVAATTTTKTTKTTTSFADGAVAPETASPLPLIALVGLAALSLGTVLLAGRDRA